jgi:D-proline reductase (dithiol) PrdB
MARLENYSEEERNHLLALPCPTFVNTPFVSGPTLSQRKVAIISTAGLHLRRERPFGLGATDYRLIPKETSSSDLVMSHISTNFDRTGFQMDFNLVFPLERLAELVKEGFIGSLADYHYSFMGASDPAQMKDTAMNIAEIMKKEGVNAVLLVPV